MELMQIIAALSDAAAYPHAAEDVEGRQPHIAVVLLAVSFVYKVNKTLYFGCLDFSTLEKRRHFCAEEVRLNRRLAEDVYLGVVPITAAGTVLRAGGEG